MGDEQDWFGEPVDQSAEGADLLGITQTGNSRTHSEPLRAGEGPAPTGGGLFRSGCGVRVTRIRTRDPGGERIGEVRRGRLLEDLGVGRRARVAIEGGPALVTSPVRQLTQLSPRAVQAQTANSVYKIELLLP